MKRGKPYLPIYAADFLALTATWSGEARALHLLMLVTSWAGAGALKADPRQLAQSLSVSPRLLSQAWADIDGQWLATPDGLRCTWLESERERVAELSRTKADAGRRGGVKSGEARASPSLKQTGSDDEANASNLQGEANSKEEAQPEHLPTSTSTSESSSGSSSESHSGGGMPPEGAATSGRKDAFGREHQGEALRIAELARPECSAAAIVTKFGPWLAAHPSQNWRKALESFASKEFFNEEQHEDVKASRRQEDIAAAATLRATLRPPDEPEERLKQRVRALHAGGSSEAAIASHLREEGDQAASIATVRHLLEEAT
jgi:uncharacterized protein YdaU (DUF1376 family)